MKKIPIGIEDFKNIISENYYYIDKTKLIEEIVKIGMVFDNKKVEFSYIV